MGFDVLFYVSTEATFVHVIDLSNIYARTSTFVFSRYFVSGLTIAMLPSEHTVCIVDLPGTYKSGDRGCHSSENINFM